MRIPPIYRWDELRVETLLLIQCMRIYLWSLTCQGVRKRVMSTSPTGKPQIRCFVHVSMIAGRKVIEYTPAEGWESAWV
ncbi:hypothetical protein [Gloeocapsopsis dulcis]|uniref:hypothetical protein n=1 Tax=Gloeocapsopsis dulcis TaxID=2859516 RepID=UPI002B25F233|nr:hypothetical protein [Gloeocapsopsis dulcis]WNN87853.1 hypothetical protein P0S91_16230 [Gloeocapsopsis dulcis]